MNKEDVCYLMVWIRKRLERLDRKEQNKYSLLRLFCDWTLHSKIDKSPQALKILKELNSSLAAFNFEKKDRDKFYALINRLSTTVSFSRFRKELILFLPVGHLSRSFIEDDEHWKPFLNFLTEIISGAPLKLHIGKTMPNRIEKFPKLFPHFLQNAHVTGLALVKRSERHTSKGRIRMYDATMLEIRIDMNTGGSILIPSVELEKVDMLRENVEYKYK